MGREGKGKRILKLAFEWFCLLHVEVLFCEPFRFFLSNQNLKYQAEVCHFVSEGWICLPEKASWCFHIPSVFQGFSSVFS